MGSATELEYLKDTYNLSLDALVLEIGETSKGKFIIFDKTIFYPKGGGQPSDIGKITTSTGFEISIKLGLFDPVTGFVQHYSDNAESLDHSLIGTTVHLMVDMTSRLLNAKAHTAGHLLDALVTETAAELKGKIGCHNPIEGCYVKFQGLLTSIAADALKDRLNKMLQVVIREQREVSHRIVDSADLSDLGLDGSSFPEGKLCRIVQITGYAPTPCGGTHISNLNELKSVVVTKIGMVKKENMTKIAYTFT